MDGIRNLFRKKLKGGGPSGEGGHRTIDPNNLPPTRKRGWENIQDHANEKRNVEARAYIANKKYDQAKAQAEARYKERQLYVTRKNRLNDIRANQNRYRNMNQGGVASMFRKKLEDGDLSPEIISQIESMAATGADASTISALVGVSEEQVNNVLMSGSTSEVMPVEGEEMVETAEVVEDPMLNLFQQNDSLNNDQAITTLFAQQEPQGIMAAANGGKAMKKIKGQDHMLAYITPGERDTLVDLGGQETMTPEGILAYPPEGNYGSEGKGQGSGPGKSGITGMGVGGGNHVGNDPSTGQKGTGQVTGPVEYIGGKEYNVNPTTVGERERARVKAQIMRTPPPKTPRSKVKVIDPITGKKLTSNKKLGGLTTGQVFGWGLTLISAGIVPAPPVVKTIASGYGTIKNIKTAINVVEKFTSKDPTPKDTKEPKTIKEAITSIAKTKAKEKIAKELKISPSQVDEITKIGINAWNSDIAESLKNKFTETFKTNKAPKQDKKSTKAPTELEMNEVALTGGKKKPPVFVGGNNDGPSEVVIPMVPEFLEEEILIEEPETSLFSMSNLKRIRDRQNRRKSFFANRGGLAGLFRVKNQ
jgi:hypothetical protein